MTGGDDGALSVDPGANSGWSLYPPRSQRPESHGQLRLKGGSGHGHTKKSADEIQRVVQRAVELGIRTMVIEGPYRIHLKKPKRKPGQPDDPEKGPGWKTYFSMGVAFGRWVQVATEHGLRVVEINPRSWQSKTVGTGPRKQQIPKYQDLAAKLCGQRVPPDAAAAVVIGFYWVVKNGWKEATT